MFQSMPGRSKYNNMKNIKKCLKFSILHPDHPLKKLWDFYMLVLLILLAYWIPFSISFIPENNNVSNLDYTLSVSFLFDIAINFSTSFYHKGILITKRKEIAKYYLKGFFWLDILSSFPYDWLPENSTNKNKSIIEILRLLKFFRVLKLLRLARIKGIFAKIGEYILNEFASVSFEILKIGLLTFMLAHWIACTFYFVSSNQLTATPITWIKVLETNREEEISTYEYYITSLYFAFTTMCTVGYGDITPQNANEMIVTISCMFLSCGYFAYILGNIGTLISKHLVFEQKKTEIRTQISRYLKKKQLPKITQIKIKAFIDNQMDNISNYRLREYEVLNLLSQPLRDEILYVLYHNIISNCEVFKKYFSESNIFSLTKAMKIENFSPNDMIFYEKQQDRKIYFICSGTVSIIHGHTNLTYKNLKKDSMFGEIGFFVDHPRTASAKCVDFTLVQSIELKDIFEYLHNKHNFELVLEFLSNACSKHNYSALLISCFLCGCLGHVADTCKTEKLRSGMDRATETYQRRRKKVKKASKAPKYYRQGYPRFYKKKITPEKIFKTDQKLQNKVTSFLVEEVSNIEIKNQAKLKIIDEIIEDSELEEWN